MATKIRQSNLDNSVVTGLTELSSERADDDLVLVFDTSTSELKKIQASKLGILAPSITSVSPTNLLTGDGTGNHTIVITGKNFVTGTTAKLKTNGGTDIAFDSLTRNSATQLTGVVAKNTANLTNANEPFDVSVTSNSITTTLENQININASPVFVTSAGSLGTKADNERTGISLSVNATDPESAGNVTFEIQSGALPAGLTLTNTAAEGGTAIIGGNATAVGSDTTSNFVLRAVDAASNTTSRAFSITIQAPAVQVFTASGTFSVPTGVSTVQALVVAGGGGGGGYSGALADGYYSGGGGAGGLVYHGTYPVTPGGTVSVTVGSGGAGKGSNPAQGDNGQNSVFGTITAQGGGGGGAANRPGNGDAGRAGGSGGGGGSFLEGSNGGPGGSGTQSPSGGGQGFGNNGGVAANGGPAGGGGGGAGAVGGNGVFPSPDSGGGTGGPGGAGKAYTIADGTTPVFYAGGGGGGGHGGMGSGEGGQGGGGDSRVTGQANIGGGGGAGSGNGGKGVVIVRWA